jgi:hypothetical protein
MFSWMKWLAALAAALSLATAGPALAKKPKTAKTEVSKAIGKCVGLVLGGAVLGALLGGRNDRGKGAAIGAGAGAAACALVMANAKRQDRIIAAQRAAAQAGGADLHMASFRDDNGREVSMTSRAQDAVISGPLIPVKYSSNGTDFVSPELTVAAPTCRYVASELTASDGSAAIPNQLYCRTADNSWEPYAIGKA